MFKFNGLMGLGFAVCTLVISGCETHEYSDDTYLVRGTVTGLQSEGLELVDQSDQRLAVIGKQFQFPRALRRGDSYRINVAKQPPTQLCKVHNGAGIIAASDVDDVTIHCRHWHTATSVFQESASSTSRIQIAKDDQRHAVAGWQQETLGDGETESDVWVTIYSEDYADWFGAFRVNNESPGRSQNPQLAVRGDRNFIIVWQRLDDQTFNIYSSFYSPAAGWFGPVAVDTGSEDAIEPRIAMNDAGAVLLVWLQSDGVKQRLVSSRLSASDGWGWVAPVVVSSDSVQSDASDAEVAIDEFGRGAAVWLQPNALGIQDVWANLYSPISGWSEPLKIEQREDVDAMTPKVTLDGNGNVVAAWVQQSALSNQLSLWVNTYSPSGAAAGWGEPEELQIQFAGDSDTHPQVMAYRSSQAIVVWSQDDGTGVKRIWAITHTPGVGWSSALLNPPRVDEPLGDAETPQIAQDGDGNVVVVWKQTVVGQVGVWAVVYSPISGWGTPVALESAPLEDSTQPLVAMGENGHALAIWRTLGSKGDIKSNRFE